MAKIIGSVFFDFFFDRFSSTLCELPPQIVGEPKRNHEYVKTMDQFQEGDVARAIMQNSDSSFSERPVLLVKRLLSYNDFLVCGLSTRHYQRIYGIDEFILPVDADFSSSGLSKASLLRLTFIQAIPANRLICKVGRISGGRLHRHQKKLSAFLWPDLKDSTESDSRETYYSPPEERLY